MKEALSISLLSQKDRETNVAAFSTDFLHYLTLVNVVAGFWCLWTLNLDSDWSYSNGQRKITSKDTDQAFCLPSSWQTRASSAACPREFARATGKNSVMRAGWLWGAVSVRLINWKIWSPSYRYYSWCEKLMKGSGENTTRRLRNVFFKKWLLNVFKIWSYS